MAVSESKKFIVNYPDSKYNKKYLRKNGESIFYKKRL